MDILPMRHDCFVDVISNFACLFISSQKDKLLVMSISYKMLNCYIVGPVSARMFMFGVLKSHWEWMSQMI
jgi:hypothetical protein